MKFNKIPSVFIIRHGERLDHVDKLWQPEPTTGIWDPPITNHGFDQAEKTGAAIHNIIRNHNINLNETSITIYTSPFQRCIDTSIGIIKGLHKSSSHWNSQPVLRIDLGLGEWMCEKFFNDICPATQLILKQQEKLARQQAYTFSILAKNETSAFNDLLPPFKVDYSYCNPQYTEFDFPETYTDMIQRFQDTRTHCLSLSQSQQGVIIFITHAIGVHALLDGFRNQATIPLESNYCSISCVRHISYLQENSDQSEEEEDSSELMDSPKTPIKSNNWLIELLMSDSHL